MLCKKLKSAEMEQFQSFWIKTFALLQGIVLPLKGKNFKYSRDN